MSRRRRTVTLSMSYRPAAFSIYVHTCGDLMAQWIDRAGTYRFNSDNRHAVVTRAGLEALADPQKWSDHLRAGLAT